MIPEAKDLKVHINKDIIEEFGKDLLRLQSRGYLTIPPNMDKVTRTALINMLLKKGYTIDRGVFSGTGNTKYIVRWA